MANPFANESTAIRVGPVESVQKSNLSSALALESKRNQIRKELNNSNLTNEEVDRIIYLRENPEMPPSIGPAITHRDAYGRPLSKEQVKQNTKKEEKRQQDIKGLKEADAIMSHSTDYIPIVGSILRGGVAQNAKTLGLSDVVQSQGDAAAISGSIDLLTLPFGGLGVKPLLTSWIGGEVGKYIGEQYNHPYIGQVAGSILGGISPQVTNTVKSGINKGIRRGIYAGMVANDGDYQLSAVPTILKHPFDFLSFISSGDNRHLNSIIKNVHTHPAGYTVTSPNYQATYQILENSPYEVIMFPEKFPTNSRVFNAGSNKGPMLVDSQNNMSPGNVEYFKKNYPNINVRTVQLFPGKDIVPFEELQNMEYIGQVGIQSSSMLMPKTKGVPNFTDKGTWRYSAYDSAGTDVSVWRDPNTNTLYYLQEDRFKFNVKDFDRKYLTGQNLDIPKIDRQLIRLTHRPLLRILDKYSTPLNVRSNIKKLDIAHPKSLDEIKIIEQLKNKGYIEDFYPKRQNYIFKQHSSNSDSEFVPAYVHQSKESDLARSGKLKDDFYDHTFNVDVGDVANYSEISDYIAPIEKDVEVLNKDLFKDILQQNINEGLLSETSAQRYFDIFNIAKNNIRNFSSLPKEYQDAVIRTIDQNLINRYFISNDGRIWGTFKVGDRWKGVNRKLNDGSSIQYITDARNVPATIAIHEGGHGIQTSIASQSSAIDLKNFVGNDAGKIDFINSLSASELSFFKAQPPSVQNLLYTNQNLFKNIPLREVTNVARDIRAMLTTKGIKTKEQLYKYINEISDDELYSLYPQTNYLRVMKENVQSKKDYVNFLKKLIIGTAFSAPIITMNNN